MGNRGFTNRAKSGARAAVARVRQAAARAATTKRRAASGERRGRARSKGAGAARQGRPADATSTYTRIEDLARAVRPPADGILSRTLFDDRSFKLVAFGFASGQELSEHTAARPAVLHVLEGRATVWLGQDEHAVGPGAWIHLPAGLRHAVRAETPLVLVLSLL
jgi:quercetin dioxygenase-like cupin family protein